MSFASIFPDKFEKLYVYSDWSLPIKYISQFIICSWFVYGTLLVCTSIQFLLSQFSMFSFVEFFKN